MFLCCASIASPASVFPGAVLTALALDWFLGMVSDGYHTQKRGSWIPVKERAERVLAGAIAIDGRKEWICKICSESNVWTRWRCRRSYNNIPAGLRGKYRQAVAAKSGEGSTGSSASSGEEDKKDAEIKELRSQIEHCRQQIGGEEQGGQGPPPRRESGLEEVW